MKKLIKKLLRHKVKIFVVILCALSVGPQLTRLLIVVQ